MESCVEVALCLGALKNLDCDPLLTFHYILESVFGHRDSAQNARTVTQRIARCWPLAILGHRRVPSRI